MIKRIRMFAVVLISFWCSACAVKIPISLPDGFPTAYLDTENMGDLVSGETFAEIMSRPEKFIIVVVVPAGADPQVYKLDGFVRALVRKSSFNDPLTGRPIERIFTFQRKMPQGNFELVPGSARALLHRLQYELPRDPGFATSQNGFVFHDGWWIDISERPDDGIAYYEFINMCAAWQKVVEQEGPGAAGAPPRSRQFGVCDAETNYYAEIGRMKWLTDDELGNLKVAHVAALQWAEDMYKAERSGGSSAAGPSERSTSAAGPAGASYMDQEISRLFTAISDRNYDAALNILQTLTREDLSHDLRTMVAQIIASNDELARRWGLLRNQ